MDTITFEISGVTIQIVAGVVCFWADNTDHPPDIELPIGKLQDVLNAARILNAARMLIKDETK